MSFSLHALPAQVRTEITSWRGPSWVWPNQLTDNWQTYWLTEELTGQQANGETDQLADRMVDLPSDN